MPAWINVGKCDGLVTYNNVIRNPNIFNPSGRPRFKKKTNSLFEIDLNGIMAGGKI